MNSKQTRFEISKKWKTMFDNEIKCCEKIHGKPLPDSQKIKAASKISHMKFAYDKGYRGNRGHNIRQRFRKAVLQTIGFNYKMNLK